MQQKSGSQISATILAATQGKRLGKLTEDKPKTLIKIGENTILEKIIDQLHNYEINDINVVAGYQHGKIDIPNLKIAVNDTYESTGQMVSLSKTSFDNNLENLIIFGDILFRKYVLQFAIEDSADVVIIVDSKFSEKHQLHSDFVKATTPDSQSFFGESAYLEQIDFNQPIKEYVR